MEILIKMRSPIKPRDLSTGEVAGILRCSQQTVIRQFDAGKLKGYRVAGSRFRRIPMECVRDYMRENNIPFLPDPTRGVLVLDQNQGLAAALKARLNMVDHAVDVYRALFRVGSTSPAAVVVNSCSIPVPVAIQFALTIEDECDDIGLFCTYPNGTKDAKTLSPHFQCIQFANLHTTSLDIVRLLRGGEE